MGEVWQATDQRTRSEVALKIIGLGLHQDPQARARFRREVRLISQVRHPGVVAVLDCIDTAHGPAIVMPLLQGRTLRHYLAERAPLSLDVSATIFLQLVDAVSACHAQGVVHRDLKPDNIFLCDGLRVQVLDFGVAKGYGPKWETLSRSNSVLGTPCYMAPEQAFGDPDLDYRADTWAVGAMLYEVLTGARPVEGENLGQVVRHLLVQGITPLQHLDPDLPADLCTLVMRALSQDRRARPGLSELKQCLGRYGGDTVRQQQDAPFRVGPRQRAAPRAWMILGAAAAVGAVAYAGVRLRDSSASVAEVIVIPAAAGSAAFPPALESEAPEAPPAASGGSGAPEPKVPQRTRPTQGTRVPTISSQAAPQALTPTPSAGSGTGPKPLSSQEGIQEEPPF